MNQYVTGVLDNDAKGTTGVGTIFFVDVTLDGIKTRHTWGLVEQIQGKFDLDAVVAPVRERLKAAASAQKAAEEQAKKEKMEQREASVVVDDVLASLVKTVLNDSGSAKAISEYKSGKEKALNALVGSVIKQIRTQKLNVSFDAFTINRALQAQLA